MSWWDRITAIFKREAADVKEGLAAAGAAIDAELERKQRELDAEPHERIEMLQDDMSAVEDRFAELEAKVQDQIKPGDELPRD
jgi:predicted nuclease with TOPRIM domain